MKLSICAISYNEADTIFLFFADMFAYKSPNEVEFMPYLDAGVMMMTTCFLARAKGIGSCIVNPNIKYEDLNKFNNIFNQQGYRFCGAVALGYPAIVPERPERKSLEDLLCVV